MNPLPDRVVLLALLTTIALCFALVFWTARLQPRPEPPLQWRDGPSALTQSLTPPLDSAPPPRSGGMAV
jgi:hypothetical protein